MRLKMLQRHHLAVMEARTIDELRARVIGFAHSLEFETVVAMTVVDHSATHTDFYCVDNTPVAYREVWNDASLFGLDPVAQHCKYSSIPLVWDQHTYVSQGQGALWEQGAAYGFKTGIVATLHLPGGRHFCIGVDRDQPLDRRHKTLTRTIADLQFFAVHACEAAAQVLLPATANSCHTALTPRELEALRWTMDGQTAWGVGRALNIAEDVAEYQLHCATFKLGCRSKFEAVLKAIRLGLLA